MPKKSQHKTDKTIWVEPKTLYIGFFCLIAIIAAIILASTFENRPAKTENELKTHPANYEAHAAWVTSDNELVQDAVRITSDGDMVNFDFDGKTNTLPNTEIIYWTNHNKEINPQNYSTHYRATLKLPSGDRVIVICYEYEDDPNCETNPSYLLYDNRTCYHVAASNVKIETHNTNTVTTETDDGVTSIETDDEMTNITIIE